MKKTVLLLILSVCFSMSADAQLSNLFNSAKKKVESSLKQSVKQGVNDAVDAALSGVNSSIVGVNPCKDFWRIDDISAYGTRTSTNYGKVYLVIKAEALKPLPSGKVSLGGDNTYAVINGEMMKPKYQIVAQFEMPEGIPMTINTKEKSGLYIENVPCTAETIQAYNIKIFFDYDNKGTVTWKNIPIQWDE